jgi:hypothetical protein
MYVVCYILHTRTLWGNDEPLLMDVIISYMHFALFFYTTAGEKIARKQAMSCPAVSYILIFISYEPLMVLFTLSHIIYQSLFIVHLLLLC